ncbi:MAG: hypothetical protein KBE65_06710 [Phycisphaerae bacterium]|nr:hypothetical protein [Phycisphaerae bacterium]
MSIRVTGIFIMLALLTAHAWAADIILNEYNAVDSNDFLGGGNSSVDESGGRAFDSYFGRVPGNGGDWFELVVIKDHLDIRGWSLDIYEDGILDETLTLTVNPIWQNLRAGTIITVSEDVPSDISYDPNAGDWWINVQANNNGDGLYIEKSSFPVSSSNWQLRIRNLAGQVVFGPAGEGVSPASGISGTEVFRLEDNPSATVTASSTDYDDGDDFSTFGSPNRWGSQSFSKLRPALTADAATVTVVTPNGTDILAAGDLVDITWTSENVSETALVEFSIDNGYSWTEVYPPNVGNAGTYTWLVPFVVSDEVLVRVSSTTRPGVFDVSDLPFEIVSGL